MRRRSVARACLCYVAASQVVGPIPVHAAMHPCEVQGRGMQHWMFWSTLGAQHAVLVPPHPCRRALPPAPLNPPRHPLHALVPAMALPVQDTEFYLLDVAKCRAVPESERSADVRALLESHDLIEAVLAVLPPPGSAAVAPPPPAVQAVAIARWLRADVVCDCMPAHPLVSSMWMALQLAGLHERGELAPAASAAFEALSTSTAAPVGALLRGIFFSVRFEYNVGSPIVRKLRRACLEMMDRVGDDATNAALAELAAAAGGAGPRLPTAAELRVACLAPARFGPQAVSARICVAGGVQPRI